MIPANLKSRINKLCHRMASSYFKKCVGIYALQPKLYRDIRPVFPLGLSEYLQVRLMDTIGSCGNRKSYDIRMPAGFLHTLLKIGRCHTVAEFIDAALQIGRYHFDLCAHIIADLPWDDRIDVEEAAKLVSVLPVTEIKIHSLYIIKGTKLAKMYEKGDIKLLPPEEYAERVVLILSMLCPDIVVQRIVGRASANTLSVNGGRPWWEVKEYIEKLMRNRHIQQGSACNYLHGAAVRRFLHK